MIFAEYLLVHTLGEPVGTKRILRVVSNCQSAFSELDQDGCEILHHQFGMVENKKTKGCLPPCSTGAGFRNHPQDFITWWMFQSQDGSVRVCF